MSLPMFGAKSVNAHKPQAGFAASLAGKCSNIMVEYQNRGCQTLINATQHLSADYSEDGFPKLAW